MRLALGSRALMHQGRLVKVDGQLPLLAWFVEDYEPIALVNLYRGLSNPYIAIKWYRYRLYLYVSPVSRILLLNRLSVTITPYNSYLNNIP